MPVRSTDVAIIGLSCLLPEAADIGEFHRNLAAGRDSVRPIPRERLWYSGLAPDPDFGEIGCLDRIDQFDHRFFNISLREAELMDPHQRLTLQLVAAAVDNAGYRLGTLRGTPTGVFLAAPRPGYADLYESDDPLIMLAETASALPGRVAYAFDLRGPALTLDTGCSGTLVAVHYARQQLLAGDARYAVAGGLSVSPVFAPRGADAAFREILAPDDRCKAFAADADGAVAGEGGAIVLLKRLQDALDDGDHIHAVLRGSAINHNGDRSNGLAAPSPAAQSAAILAAWDDGGVDAATVGYVEAHGSGTRLGDVIEVQGLTEAFAARGVTELVCAIGSVKSNIGHLDAAAGIAGLVKAVLSLRHATLYPSLHIDAPNPLIDFDHAPVRVNDRLQAWEMPDGTPRRAGVSSFSLAGTNAHLVLEEAPPRPVTGAAGTGPELVTVSAKTREALARSCTALADALEGPDATLAEVAHVCNRGRDDHRYRLAWAVSDLEGLRERLREGAEQAVRARPAALDRPVVLLLSGASTDPEQIRAELTAMVDTHRALRRLGVTETALLGAGTGNAAVRIVRDGLGMDEAVQQAADAGSGGPDPDRLAAALDDLAPSDPVFCDLGPGPVLGDAVAEASGRPVIRATAGAAGLLDVLRRLYLDGVAVDWDRYYQGRAPQRVELPGYPFEPTRCWCREPGDQFVWSDGRRAAAEVPQPRPVPAERPPEVASNGFATATQAQLAAVWGGALKADVTDPAADYFELGGTSITGIQVIDEAERAFGVRITFEDLYAHNTIARLAALIDDLVASGGGRSDEPQLEPVPRDGDLPLSFGQERLWFLDQMEPDSALYNILMQLRFRGRLDAAALQASFTDIMRRHEVLRTRFASADGEPRLVVDDEPRFDMPLVDLSQRGEDGDREAEAARLLAQEATRPFDLATGPMLRGLLVRLSPTDHVLGLTFHHIADDGWSRTIIQRELSALYTSHLDGSAVDLPRLPVQYVDYAAWQRDLLQGERLDRETAYWADVLADPPALDLPSDRPRPPVQTYAGDLLSFALPAGLTEGVRALARREHVTPFVVLFAAFQVFLHRLSGQDDIVVGIATAGRNKVETRDLIGFFNNSVAFRGDLSGDPTFLDLLARLRPVVAGALDHQDVPFEKIVEALQPPRDLSRNPFFDAMYTHQNAPHGDFVLPDLEVSDFRGASHGIAPGTAKFDLTLGLSEAEGLDVMPGMLEYSTDLFDEATARRMLGQLHTLLGGIVAAPDRHLSALPMLDAEERHKVLVTWNDTATDYQPRCFHQLVADQARRTPDAVAVESDAQRLTYAELDRRANQLARHLQELGVHTEDIVGVSLRRTPQMIVALLAAMKAGGAYLPIDPDYPDERRAFMLSDAGAKVLVDEAFLAAERDAIAAAPADEPATTVTPDDLAYVIYTSGSTGRPKGVMVTHRGVRNLAEEQARALDVRAGDRVLQFVSISFDVSLSEMLLALTTGATLILGPGVQLLPGPELMDLLRRERITHLSMPPSVLAAMPYGDLPDLRVVVAGGESCPAELATRWAAGRRLFNGYGPTEATVYATLVEVTEPGARPVIGRPMANTRLYLLDEQLRPVPIGVPGEICLGGVGLARGYLGREELTAERFVPNPFTDDGTKLYRTGDLGRFLADGRVEFLGRNDTQVKVRGYRIELGEIEAALTGCDGVAKAVVTVDRQGSADARLVAYVVLNEPGGAPVEELRERLRDRLPGYLVPQAYVTLDRFPLTPNGKLDRAALPAPEGDRSISADSFLAPRSPTEELVAGIWSAVIGVDRVGVRDNFFDLGGHSLQATRVVARISDAFGIALPVRSVFEAPTVEGLAGRVGELRGGSDVADEIARTLAEVAAMADDEATALLAGFAGGRSHGEDGR